MARSRASAKAAGARFEREEWLPIPGWEGAYEGSSLGNIRSVERAVTDKIGRVRTFPSKVLKPRPGVKGQPFVNLCRDGACKNYTPGSLVALTFHGPRPEGEVVRHLNDDPWDNRPENIKYGAQRENVWDCIANGNHSELSKTHCPRRHELHDGNITEAGRRRGFRDCLACNRARAYISKRGGDLQEVSDAYYQRSHHVSQ